MGLYGKIFGDTEADQLYDKIDSIVDSIPDSLPDNSNEQLAASAVREYINGFTDSKSGSSDLEQIIGNIAVPQERLNRYMIYDEIYRSVQLIKRIFKVYIANILQHDLVTNRLFIYKQVEENDNKTNTEYTEYKKYCNDLLDNYKLEKKLRYQIIPKWLKYGDYFIHIIDLSTNDIEIPFATSSQSYTNSNTGNNGTIITEAVIDTLLQTHFSYSSNNISYIDEQKTESNNSKDDSETTDDKFEYDFNHVALQYIDPKKVVILKSDYNDIILGYIVITESNSGIAGGMGETYNLKLQMASTLSQVYGQLQQNNKSLNDVTEKLTDKLVNYILQQNKIPEKSGLVNTTINEKERKRVYDEILRTTLTDDVYYLIKELLIDRKFKKSKYKIKFIPTDRMVHIQMPSSEYFPYGESLVDPLVYPAKLYLINQLANTVIKLSRAAVIRKWTVETGPRDIHSNLLQKLRREFRNQRITANDIMSFKSIPKMISDFKDLVIFQKKGQRFVDVDVQSIGDPNTKVTDLEDARRELISTSGVPAAYLGQADIADLRESLVNANISFAEEISNMQRIVTFCLSDIVDKTWRVFHPKSESKPSDVVRVTLTPPIILTLQMLESTVSSLGNILQTFQGLPDVDADPFYLLERYLPYIDWTEFKEAANKYAVESKNKHANDEQ